MILMDRILSTGFMKEMEHKNLESLGKLLASQPLKKMVTQLVVSVSIFSLVFSWSSLCSTIPLIYSEKLYYFYWNSLQLLSIATNKNCIFLICNGILVFLAKTSAFVRSPSGFDLNEMLQKRISDGLQMETESHPLFEKQIMLEENGDSTKQEEEEAAAAAEEEFECLNKKKEEVSISIAESDVENDEGEPKICWLFDVDEDDKQVSAEEELDETEKLSTEELNQKFEEFIRRMKEFRINEARQQLVMVN